MLRGCATSAGVHGSTSALLLHLTCLCLFVRIFRCKLATLWSQTNEPLLLTVHNAFTLVMTPLNQTCFCTCRFGKTCI